MNRRDALKAAAAVMVGGTVADAENEEPPNEQSHGRRIVAAAQKGFSDGVGEVRYFETHTRFVRICGKLAPILPSSYDIG